jgi:VanZ family protein
VDYKIIFGWLKQPYLASAATLAVSVLLAMPAGEVEPSRYPMLNDKLAHGLVFAGLAFLWLQYLRRAPTVILGLALYAIGTEVLQYLLPASFARSFDLKDIVADLCGLSIGLSISYVFDLIRR